jgi:hypothetical protein
MQVAITIGRQEKNRLLYSSKLLQDQPKLAL